MTPAMAPSPARAGQARRAILLIVGVALVLGGALPLPTPVALASLWLGGGALVWRLALATDTARAVLAIAGAGALTRTLLAVGLFAISKRGLPFARSLQMSQGFWAFSPDSAYLHEYARGAAVALHAGLGLPFVSGQPDYPLLVTLAYRWLGPHPLYVIFAQIWAIAAATLLAAALARPLGGRRGALLTALMVAFWPSLVLWSTQLLKDALVVPLVLGCLFVSEEVRKSLGRRRAGWLVLFGVVLFVLLHLRFYEGAALALSSGLVSAVAAVWTWRVERTASRGSLAILPVLALTVVLVVAVNPEWIAKPLDREGSHRRLAEYMLAHGDEHGAYWQLRGAASVYYDSNDEIDAAARRDLEAMHRGEPVTPPAARPMSRPPAPAPALAPARPAPGTWERLTGIAWLQTRRNDFLKYRGASNVDVGIRLDSLTAVVRYLPAAIFNATLMPTPFTKFAASGSTGGFRTLAEGESLLTTALLALAALGLVRSLRDGSALVASIVLYAALLAVGIGLTVPTVGLLARFRLGFVVPLFIVAAGAMRSNLDVRRDSRVWWAGLLEWLRSWSARRGTAAAWWMVIGGVTLLAAAMLPLPVKIGLLLFWLGMTGIVAGLAHLVTRDLVVVGVVVGSHLLRSVAAVGLYEISARGLPVFQRLQFGDGFWMFSPDSSYHHQYARWVAVALSAGLEIPHSVGAPEYSLFVAVLYVLFGPHPLYPVVLQLAMVAFTALLMWRLGVRLGGVQVGRVAAVLTVLWPSLSLWSTQLLKDAMCILLIAGFLVAFDAFQTASSWKRAAWTLALAVSVLLLYRLRFYYVMVLVIAAVMVAGVKVGVRAWRGRWREVPAPALLVVVLIGTVVFSSSLNREWFGRPHDAVGVSRRLAARMLATGEIPGAVWQLGSVVTTTTGALPGTPEYDAGIDRELAQLLKLDTSAKPGAPGFEAALEETLQRLRRPGEARVTIVRSGPARTGPSSHRAFVSLDEVEATANTISRISTLDSMRRGFVTYGGASNVDTDVRFTGPLAVVRYLPKAMVNAALTPNPFTPFAAVGATGNLRTFSMIEVGLVALVLVLAGRGTVRTVGRSPEVVACIVLFSLLLMAMLGLVVPTVGLLFRFRLGFVIPLCVLAAAGAVRIRAPRPDESTSRGAHSRSTAVRSRR